MRTRTRKNPHQRTSTKPGPGALANDRDYADKPAAEKGRLDRELVRQWKGPGDPEMAREAVAVRKNAKQREAAGE